MDFGGFDSSSILIFRGWNSQVPHGDFPQSLSQQILAGKILNSSNTSLSFWARPARSYDRLRGHHGVLERTDENRGPLLHGTKASMHHMRNARVLIHCPFSVYLTFRISKHDSILKAKASERGGLSHAVANIGTEKQAPKT